MNLTVENSQQMHIKLRRCVGVVADHLKVLAPGHSPNTDGIHLSASKDVVIRNAIIGTGICTRPFTSLSLALHKLQNAYPVLIFKYWGLPTPLEQDH